MSGFSVPLPQQTIQQKLWVLGQLAFSGNRNPSRRYANLSKPQLLSNKLTKGFGDFWMAGNRCQFARSWVSVYVMFFAVSL